MVSLVCDTAWHELIVGSESMADAMRDARPEGGPIVVSRFLPLSCRTECFMAAIPEPWVLMIPGFDFTAYRLKQNGPALSGA